MLGRAQQLAVVVLVLAGVPVGADEGAENSWYVGAAGGIADASLSFHSLFGALVVPDVPDPSGEVPEREVSGDFSTQREFVSLALGRHVGEHFRLQVEASHLGATSPSKTALRITDFVVNADTRIADGFSVGVAAMPELPLAERWSAYAKLGWRISELQLEVDAIGVADAQPRKDQLDGAIVGAGILWRQPSQFDFFAEIESWDTDSGPPASGLSADRPGSSVRGSETRVLFGSLFRW